MRTGCPEIVRPQTCYPPAVAPPGGTVRVRLETLVEKSRENAAPRGATIDC